MDAKLLEESTKLANLYGLGVVLSIFIALMLFGLIWYVLKTGAGREKSLSDIINGTVRHMNDLLLQHDQRAIDAVKSLAQANEYQRQEHKEMIEVLRDINSRVRA